VKNPRSPKRSEEPGANETSEAQGETGSPGETHRPDDGPRRTETLQDQGDETMEQTSNYGGSAKEAGWHKWNEKRRTTRIYAGGKVVWQDTEYLSRFTCAECGESCDKCKCGK